MSGSMPLSATTPPVSNGQSGGRIQLPGGDGGSRRRPEQEPPSHSYYFVGKDNIAFHTIFWPAILMGLGGLTLPYDVPASEFMTMGGFKSIASRGDVIWTKDAIGSLWCR